MNRGGFEALADGVMLLTILLVATGIVSLPLAPSADLGDRIEYAADTRDALFRTTLDGLVYRVGAEVASMPTGTTVEDYLRVQARVLALRPDGDFEESNGRLRDLAERLVRPGWAVAIAGGVEGAERALHIGPTLPAEYASAPRTYPPLASGEPDTVLVVAVFALGP